MSEFDEESVVVRDRASRRRFIRKGAAFIAVGSVAAAAPNVYADDCDRNQGEEKNVQAPGSDSDAGESADPTGCGKQPKPKISQNQRSLEIDHNAKVAKIKA